MVAQRSCVPMTTLFLAEHSDRKSCHRDASKEAVLHFTSTGRQILVRELNACAEMQCPYDNTELLEHSDRKCVHGDSQQGVCNLKLTTR